MRIGIVIERLDPARGGAETYTADFVRWLLAQGVGVTVIAAGWDPRLQAELERLSPAVAFERVASGAGPRALRAIGFAHRSARQVAALRQAGVIQVSLDMGGGLGCDVVQPHCGAPTDATRGHLDSLENPLNRAWRQAAASAAPTEWLRARIRRQRFSRRPPPHVVAVSARVAGSLHRLYGIPEANLHLIPNGVDLDRFAPERLWPLRAPARAALDARGRLVVLTVAHNYRLKGVASVIELAARAERRDDPFRFVVVGGSRRVRAAFAARARRAGASEMRFIAATADVAPFYAAADAFLLPTFYDACSLTVLEALAAGVPVITTRRNGAADLLRGSGAGFVVDHPRDVAALEQCLNELARDDARAWGRHNARAAAGRHSCELNFARVLGVLEQAAGGRRALDRETLGSEMSAAARVRHAA